MQLLLLQLEILWLRRRGLLAYRVVLLLDHFLNKWRANELRLLRCASVLLRRHSDPEIWVLKQSRRSTCCLWSWLHGLQLRGQHVDLFLRLHIYRVPEIGLVVWHVNYALARHHLLVCMINLIELGRARHIGPTRGLILLRLINQAT